MLRSKLLLKCCALALTFSACADNNTSVFVAGVMAAEAPECEYRADQSATLFPSGTLDVGFRTSYEAVLLVGLQLAPRGRKANLRAETMIFQVRGAEVRLTTSTGTLVDEFSVPAGGRISPSAAETPGFGVTEVQLIHSERGRALQRDLGVGQRRALVAEVRVFGDTAGGAELTSGSFTYNINVCHGCMRTVVENGTRVDAMGRQFCDFGVTEPTIFSGCRPGQDNGLADCRVCATDECRNASF